MASAVFFLRRQQIRFGRAHLADLRVDLDQLFMQALQFPEFSDFSFGLSGCRLVGQGFGNRLAVDLVGQAEIGTMAWVLWLLAMAAWFAASTSCGSDRATPQIAESRDLIGNVGPLLFEGFQRLGHRHRAAS